MTYTHIAYEVADRVATITLDRPDRLNAFTVTMQRELCAALDEVDADPDVRAVVVTGRGRGFCAGADLAGGEASFDAGTAEGRAVGPPPPPRPRPPRGGLSSPASPTAGGATRAVWWPCGSSAAPSP
jgi:hypothetical protein